MADSNITKKALASALKELMNEKPFEKINVGDICDKCEMNRKSFYYHFKDKYDLVNWIFDTEFIAIARKEANQDIWTLVEVLCNYFYANRNFYKKALCIKGQNSFSDHFREILFPTIVNRMNHILDKGEISDFQVTFMADAVVMAFQRWLVDSVMLPEEFIKQMRLSIKYVSTRYEEIIEKTCR
ncbi:MAG: TetR/AcrR family transcriptional regulator C-terminal domain-containing protein [Lachnospiraceae bacterium]|nr:TetR/AcrR family transcriptional regulator C-terminal domain-containing protein [Lachnospiraceae bacterium]